MLEVTDDRVIDAVANAIEFDRTKISRASRFKEDLHADSLDRVELQMDVEELFQLEIPDEETEKVSTVGELIDLLRKHQAATAG